MSTERHIISDYQVFDTICRENYTKVTISCCHYRNILYILDMYPCFLFAKFTEGSSITQHTIIIETSFVQLHVFNLVHFERSI